MTEANTQVQDTTKTEPVQDTEADVLTTVADTEISKEKFSELLNQKRKANREAQDAKKRLEELEAQLKEIKDKEKTEIQLAKERADKAEQVKKDLELSLYREKLIRTTMSAGVLEQYSTFVAGELERAITTDTDLDQKKWFAEFKRTNSAFFGQVAKPMSTAEGGPSSATITKEAERIKKIEHEIEDAIKQNNQSRVFLKRQELSMIQKGIL